MTTTEAIKRMMDVFNSRMANAKMKHPYATEEQRYQMVKESMFNDLLK